MECKGCGGTYNSEYNYCPWRGRVKPDKPTINVHVEEPRLETYEVDFEPCEEGAFVELPTKSIMRDPSMI